MKSTLLSLLMLLPATGAVASYPHTDPGNVGNWVLLEGMSDEFETAPLDEAKWLVQGRNGQFQSNFRGRGYTDAEGGGGWQFSPDNVRVENGLLKITTKYEPDYPWIDLGNGTNDFDFTTGAVITKQTFLRGYMEIRCKAANAKTTSSFWTTGNGAELDVFEAIGSHATRTDKMWSTIHDWQLPSTPNYVWTETATLPFDFGDGFHTYAAEWDDTSVKFYADGQLITTATKAWVEQNGIYSQRWPLTGGQYVWADSEIFPWWGVPPTNSLPADYEIEYIRVWQRSERTPWQEFAFQYGLPGYKSAHSDADDRDDWSEYVLGGNPTNPADIGVMPSFDAQTGAFLYQVRNDTSLVARVVSKTDLAAPAWTTNGTVHVASHDGGMGNYTNLLGTAASNLFAKLVVEDLYGVGYHIVIGEGGSNGVPSSGNGNFEAGTGSGAGYAISLMPHWHNLTAAESQTCGTTTGMEGSPEPNSHGCWLFQSFTVANDTGYTVVAPGERFYLSLHGKAHGDPSVYNGDEKVVLILFTTPSGVTDATGMGDITVLGTTKLPVSGGWAPYVADSVYLSTPADVGKTVYLGLTLENPTGSNVFPRFDRIVLEVNK